MSARALIASVVLVTLAPTSIPAADVVGLARLTDAIARYRAIDAAGDGRVAAAGPTLRPGDRHAAVHAVRTRLAATGDLAPQPHDTTLYDAETAAAIRRFQDRHGLAPDGVLGPATRAALATPIATRVAQLEATAASRTRPAPASRWIRINVPAFELEVRDGDAVVLAMPVIVGRRERPTPVLEATISWLMVNPPWTVPPLLAYEDMLPKIQRDPGYLARRGIEVFDGWRPDARRLDPSAIDWSTIGAGIRDLTLRQRPGAGNALGRLLFYMDNLHDVYLHDTPSRALFGERRRDFSSGCIRVADARGLAREMLRGDPAWPAERLEAVIRGGDTTPVRLATPMPIRVVYETAWVDERATVHFRDDIYDRVAPAAADSRLDLAGQDSAHAAPVESTF